MKKLIIGMTLALILVFTAACSHSSTSPDGVGGGSSRVTITKAVPAPMQVPTIFSTSSGKSTYSESQGATPASDSSYASDNGSTSTERMIVRNANMEVVVGDVTKARDGISALADTYGGFVVSSQISGEGEDMYGWVSIRVTDDKLDQAMSDVRGLSVRVKSENTSSQDITEQYVDTGARLSNAEASEKEYLALLNKAEKVEDIAQIYNYLTQIRQTIEQYKAQMQYMERTSALSLLSVSLSPETSAKPLVKQGWKPMEILKAAVRGLVNFAQVLGTIALWLLIFIPVWGTVLGIIWWRVRKKRQQKA
jgi:hypothetical protein